AEPDGDAVSAQWRGAVSSRTPGGDAPALDNPADGRGRRVAPVTAVDGAGSERQRAAGRTDQRPDEVAPPDAASAPVSEGHPCRAGVPRRPGVLAGACERPIAGSGRSEPTPRAAGRAARLGPADRAARADPWLLRPRLGERPPAGRVAAAG